MILGKASKSKWNWAKRNWVKKGIKRVESNKGWNQSKE